MIRAQEISTVSRVYEEKETLFGAADSLFLRGEWLCAAVEYERVVYSDFSLLNVNHALMKKSLCYKQAGQFDKAASTLDRIMMYALPELKVKNVLYEKILCNYLAGNHEAAASYIAEVKAVATDFDEDDLLLHTLVYNECGRWDEAESSALELVNTAVGESPSDSIRVAALSTVENYYDRIPKIKNRQTAFFLSFIPGLGQTYAGKTGEGCLSLLLNAAVLSFGIWQGVDAHYATAILGAGIPFSYTYLGGFERSETLVDNYNREVCRVYNDKIKFILMELLDPMTVSEEEEDY